MKACSVCKGETRNILRKCNRGMNQPTTYTIIVCYLPSDGLFMKPHFIPVGNPGMNGEDGVNTTWL